jgi:hypothetical protein
MDSPKDGIVYSNPVLGQVLFVQASAIQMANCGEVTRCEYRVVKRGTTGSEERATMIFVKTELFPKGFLVYPATGLPVPRSFQETLHRMP